MAAPRALGRAPVGILPLKRVFLFRAIWGHFCEIAPEVVCLLEGYAFFFKEKYQQQKKKKKRWYSQNRMKGIARISENLVEVAGTWYYFGSQLVSGLQTKNS
jgi:hypothetical protein